MNTALTAYPFEAAARTILGRERRIGALETEVLSLFEVPLDRGVHNPAGLELIPGVVPVAEFLGDLIGVVEGFRQLARVLPAPSGLAGAVAANHDGHLRNQQVSGSSPLAAPFPPRSASIRKLRARRPPSAHRAATPPPDRTRVARAPPRTRRGPRLTARRRRHPHAVPATPARGRHRGRAPPARSRTPPARSRPRRRTAAPGPADPRPPQRGGDPDRDRARTRERRPAILQTPTRRITRRAHTTTCRRRA